jgi:hypothetical protein
MSQIGVNPAIMGSVGSWLSGATKTVGDTLLEDYLASNFPERVAPIDTATARVVDTAVPESVQLQKALDSESGLSQRSMLMVAAGAALLLAIVLVRR